MAGEIRSQKRRTLPAMPCASERQMRVLQGAPEKIAVDVRELSLGPRRGFCVAGRQVCLIPRTAESTRPESLPSCRVLSRMKSAKMSRGSNILYRPQRDKRERARGSAPDHGLHIRYLSACHADSHQLRSFDVYRVLVAELSFLYAENEAEALNMAGEV